MKIFILEHCPHCRRAKDYLRELLAENEKYKDIEFEFIDEAKDVSLADSYDYYYVPSFFDGDKKLHEGTINKKQLKELLDSYLGG